MVLQNNTATAEIARPPRDRGGLAGRWLRLWRGKPPGPGLLMPAIGTALLMLLPVLYVMIRGLQGGYSKWLYLLDTRIPGLLRNTLGLAAVVGCAAVVIGVSLAWLVVRTDLPGRGIWRWVLAMPLVVPPYVGAMAYIVVFGPAGLLRDVFGRPVVPIYSFGGVAFVLTMFTYPYVLLIAAALLKRMSREYEEVALAAGVSRGQLLRRVTLPFLRPAIGAGGVLVVLYVFADFGAVTMLRYTTFTSAIYFQIGTFDMAAASVLSLTLILLSLGFVRLEHRTREQLTVHQTYGTLRPPLPARLGPWTAVALLWVGIVVFFAVVLPLGVLIYWSWAGIAAGGLGKGFWGYAWNSIRLAGIAAAACVAVTLPLVYMEARHPSPVSRLTGTIAHAGHALPGVVVALGLVFVTNRYAPFLYRSGIPLVLAYSVRFLTQSLRAGEAAMSLVPPSLDEAGRSLGLTPSEASARITWPLIRPGLMAGGLLVFVSALKELPATLLLRPPGMDTLAVRVWVSASEGYFSAAAPIALVIVAISMIPLRWMLRDS